MDTKAIVVARRARAKAAIAARQRDVEALLALQVPPVEIHAAVAPKHGGVDIRTIQRDITAVYAKWEAEAEVERPRYREQARQTLRKVIRAAFAKGDYKSVVSAQRELSRIDGLYVENPHSPNAPTPSKDPDEFNIAAQMAKMTSGEKRDKLRALIDAYAPPVASRDESN